jgi:hypothetical protein
MARTVRHAHALQHGSDLSRRQRRTANTAVDAPSASASERTAGTQ